jgi:hypothetical protein
MNLSRLVPLFAAAAALAGCGSKKSASNDKPIESAVPTDKAAPAAASAAPAAVVPAPAAGAPATKLGAFDLTAATINVETLFPGATITLHPAGDDEYEVDTVVIARGTETVAEIELAKDKATTVRVYEHPAFESVAKEHADASCIQDKYGVRCTTGDLTYLLDDNAGMDGEWGTEAPIAKVDGAGAKASWIEWSPAEAKRPTVVVSNTPEGEADHDGDQMRKPTAAEIDRCARLEIMTRACGYGYDYEYGWVKGKTAKVSPAAARKACDLPVMATEDGWAMPVPDYTEAQVAALEKVKGDCKAFTTELENHGLVNQQLP